MITAGALDAYFEYHLKKQIWSDAGEERQNAAMVMAESDVSGALGEMELDENDKLHVAAAAEQALYLLNQPEHEVKGALEDALVSESIDGIGSRNYAVRSSGNIGGRAGEMIRRIKRRNGIRIVRG